MNQELDRDRAERFRAVIAARLGLYFDDGKLGFLADLLRQRLVDRGAPEVAYLQELTVNGGNELRWLASHLTVSETYFFRNPNQFCALAELALPQRLAARGGGRTLRLLSAGCASGEEPYSLAITWRGLPETAGWDLSLHAVDVNPAAVEKAKRGRYTDWSLRETSVETRNRHFRREAGEFVLDPEIRALVSFEERNLGEDDAAFWREGEFDVIFCRNVIMYLVPDRMQVLVQRLAAALAPGGFLFLGHAETLRGLSHDFHLRHTHGTFYYQKKNGRGPRPVAVAAAAAPAVPWTESGAGNSWIEAIGAASERIQNLFNVAARPAPGAPEAEPAAARGTEAMRRALELLQREKYREALQALDAPGPHSHAEDADAQLLRAVLLTNCGEVPAAEAACAAVLATDDLNPGAHYVLALCREHAGDPAGAREQDRLAAHLDPEFAIPHLHLGVQARRAGDLAAAGCELRQALALLPGEDATRILLFGGGFSREALLGLVRAQLRACGGSA